MISIIASYSVSLQKLRQSSRIFYCSNMAEKSTEPQIDSTETPIKSEKSEEKKPEWPWRKAKKVAVMLSFVGKDYLGMQR